MAEQPLAAITLNYAGTLPAIASANVLSRLGARLIDGAIIAAAGLFYLIPGVCYFIARDTIGAASIGRRLVGLHVVDAHTAIPVDSSTAFTRGLLQFAQCFTLGVWPLIDLGMAIGRPDHCTSVDLITKTRVVKKQRVVLDPEEFFDAHKHEWKKYSGKLVVVIDDGAAAFFDTYAAASIFADNYRARRIHVGRVP